MKPGNHWPSLFIRQPSTSRNQLNETSNSSVGQRSSYEGSSLQRDEGSTPGPKPRWNPKPEQIRILEAIFNSGLVNPPIDEIKRITTQLQEFGEVGEANVFYWFQNRKSRTKQRQRQIQAAERAKSSAVRTTMNVGNNTTANSLHNNGESSSAAVPAASFYTHQDHCYHRVQVNEEMHIDQSSYMQAPGNESNKDSIYGPSITVFINEIPVELPVGPINLKAVFGENAILLHSSGQPVLVNEWGYTLQGLLQGAMYYLVGLIFILLYVEFKLSKYLQRYLIEFKF
uniref:WUSCHEL homeobox protein WOX8A n=1 Tax=Picea abies TaxID=3329 RepID=R9R833_PICAB|nr:WUSCHEL homeobox protein WOX8A [Picea abies]